MKTKNKFLQWRCDTPALLQEVLENNPTMATLKIPINIFKRLLGNVSERAIELNDPIMNKCMFDLNLYELPAPTTPEYSSLMKKVYTSAERQRKVELKKEKGI